jgi:transposase-like protein
VEIILGQARRRWSEDEKRALVAETFVDGQTVHGVARRHNVSRSMLFGWRKQYCETLGFAAPASTPILRLLRSRELSRANRRRRLYERRAKTPARSTACPPVSGAVDPDLAAAVMKALPRR